MLTLDPHRSELLIIDFQARLMPAIDRAEERLANARRLILAAEMLGLRRHVTEQNPLRLGGTLPELGIPEGEALAKMSFDSLRTPEIAARLEGEAALVTCGCEAHVCVLQTVLGLLERGRKVYVAADAIGSRTPENRLAAIDRMQRHGAEIVTTEMVLFEWLGDATHPAFKPVTALIK